MGLNEGEVVCLSTHFRLVCHEPGHSGLNEGKVVFLFARSAAPQDKSDVASLNDGEMASAKRAMKTVTCGSSCERSTLRESGSRSPGVSN